ncbi:MAG TPA: hypothetical protein VNY52_06810 [Solirubrobacteraceae bacterium]|jgi:hypothetical protein|nr:hypothetical protein [Solirubrobacteraceae bacterium]
MFSRIRKRLTYANVALTLALVFAMSGGALAASRYVITSTKQISPKVLKSLQGRAGAAGANGAQGVAGPPGPQGPAGAKGEAGAPGAPGKDGTNGTNGTNGTTGFTETLPSGKTLKGVWTLVDPAGKESGAVLSSVSFGIPLHEAPVAVYIKAGEEPPAGSGCTGNAQEPAAEKGFLCVFAAQEINDNAVKICALSSPALPECVLSGSTADKFGFGLLARIKEDGSLIVNGTWAVTAE